ncbi:beta-N-acetylhexosaminidase [Arenibaculum pallidiluteum]|uniref:beta-N-acetylhexosaminidase n=1 Tax=Arenibaculum pallidiluteum TaxID=2812559 RepID=UPI001A975F76|nr:beta-N-acetylhexosaminidase [Arenibaculum pallidiluteum]
MTRSKPAAAVFGCSGLALSDEERAFFRDADPFGFILFRRNCGDPEQVRRLVDDMRASVDRPDAPVMIDQEGGRVARLRPPHWPAHPPLRRIGDIALGDPEAAAEAAWINGRLIGHMLHELGITIDCAPVCDVPVQGAHDVIGDRAFCDDPEMVGALARVSCLGFLDAGVLPVVKHLPGHGRAFADSHLELPVVEADRVELARTDFVPFTVLADMPIGMVAHVVYTAIDSERPASVSPTVIGETIRGALSFGGLLLSDDMSMQALAGDMAARTRALLDAGCDVAVHCNGDMAEMRAVAGAVRPMDDAGWARWIAAHERLRVPSPIDPKALRARMDELLGGADA